MPRAWPAPGDRRALRIPPLRHEAGLGLPVRRHDGRLLLATHFLYPRGAALARYDFLFLAALGVQAALLVFRLETVEEAKVIVAYHVVGTVMEIFKTSVGSWIYPEDAFFRIAGVPLFTGFMYSASAPISAGPGGCSISSSISIRRSPGSSP